MKKTAVISFIAAIIFFLSACGLNPDPFELYENFITDLDINARIEEDLQKVKEGDTSPYFVSSIEALYYDLDTFDQEDDTAHSINMLYTECVQLMLYSIDYNKINSTEEAQKMYYRSKDRYSEAQQLYYEFLLTYQRDN